MTDESWPGFKETIAWRFYPIALPLFVCTHTRFNRRHSLQEGESFKEREGFLLTQTPRFPRIYTLILGVIVSSGSRPVSWSPIQFLNQQQILLGFKLEDLSGQALV